jgi:hypothetical protein
MRGVLVAAVLMAAVVSSDSAPARAGALGDAVVSLGSWLSDVEVSVSAWIDRTWGRVVGTPDDDRAADAFRRLAVESPEQLDALAGKAGYALSGFTVSRAGRQDLVLRFRHDRDLGPEERLTAMRELKELGMMDARPELSLVRILLDATDWRDAGTGTRFELTGVEVHVGDAVSSRFVFSELGVVR